MQTFGTTALLLFNAGLALGYSLPSMPQHHRAASRSTDPAPSKRFLMEDQASARMFLKDNNDDKASSGPTFLKDENDACGVIFAEEPVEDPTYACWLNPENDRMDDYICVHEHPCLDIEDGAEHGEDSY